MQKQKQRELEQQRIRDAQKEKMEIERQQRLREDFASQDFLNSCSLPITALKTSILEYPSP